MFPLLFLKLLTIHANAARFRYFESFVCVIDWPFPKPHRERFFFPLGKLCKKKKGFVGLTAKPPLDRGLEQITQHHTQKCGSLVSTTHMERSEHLEHKGKSSRSQEDLKI